MSRSNHKQFRRRQRLGTLCAIAAWSQDRRFASSQSMRTNRQRNPLGKARSPTNKKLSAQHRLVSRRTLGYTPSGTFAWSFRGRRKWQCTRNSHPTLHGSHSDILCPRMLERAYPHGRLHTACHHSFPVETRQKSAAAYPDQCHRCGRRSPICSSRPRSLQTQSDPTTSSPQVMLLPVAWWYLGIAHPSRKHDSAWFHAARIRLQCER